MGIFIYHIFFWVRVSFWICFSKNQPQPKNHRRWKDSKLHFTRSMLELAKAAVMCPCSWWRRVPQVSPWDRRLRPLELLLFWCCRAVHVYSWRNGCKQIGWWLRAPSWYWKCTLEDLGSKGGWNPWFAETEDIYPTNLPLIPAIFCWLTSCYPPPKFSETWDKGQVWHASLHDGWTGISGEIFSWPLAVFLCAISYHFKVCFVLSLHLYRVYSL